MYLLFQLKKMIVIGLSFQNTSDGRDEFFAVFLLYLLLHDSNLKFRKFQLKLGQCRMDIETKPISWNLLSSTCFNLFKSSKQQHLICINRIIREFQNGDSNKFLVHTMYKFWLISSMLHLVLCFIYPCLEGSSNCQQMVSRATLN